MQSLKLKDIKKGQTFYECERGYNLKAVAMENAHLIEDEYNTVGWRLDAIVIEENKHRIVNYFEALNPGAYGLKLYDNPQYVNFEIPRDYSKKHFDELETLLLNLFKQVCFDKDYLKYNHRNISAFEETQKYLVDNAIISDNECEYGTF